MHSIVHGTVNNIILAVRFKLILVYTCNNYISMSDDNIIISIQCHNYYKREANEKMSASIRKESSF